MASKKHMLAKFPPNPRTLGRNASEISGKRCERCPICPERGFAGCASAMENGQAGVCCICVACHSVEHGQANRNPHPGLNFLWRTKPHSHNKSHKGHQMLQDIELVTYPVDWCCGRDSNEREDTPCCKPTFRTRRCATGERYSSIGPSCEIKSS